jgi:branched-chain amino acid transport system substrate-binding protein
MRKVLLAIAMVIALMIVANVALVAEETVKLGILYPITGPLSSTGKIYVQAYELYVDLVNNSYDIDSPGDIIRSEGLPNLDGAKIELIIADTEGKPDVGKSEAERLISVKDVDVMMGAFQSAVTATSSEAAERWGVPYLNPASSSPTLTDREFGWFFRTGPDEYAYVGSMMQFLEQLDAAREDVTIEKVAIVAEDTLWGQDTADIVVESCAELGYDVVDNIAYPHEAIDVDAEVLRLKRSEPDVIVMASYLPDALLFQKAFRKYDVDVPILANGTGHTKPGFVLELGADANYVMSRQTWANVIIESNPIASKIDEMLKERYGADAALTDTSARTYVGFMTLMDAINRAGSTDAAAIKQALLETDIEGELICLPWEGVSFDPETHQNVYGRVMMIQYIDEVQKVIWPWDTAEVELIWDIP